MTAPRGEGCRVGLVAFPKERGREQGWHVVQCLYGPGAWSAGVWLVFSQREARPPLLTSGEVFWPMGGAFTVTGILLITSWII